MKVILNLTRNAPSFEKGRLGWIALTRNTYVKRYVDTYAQREKGLSKHSFINQKWQYLSEPTGITRYL